MTVKDVKRERQTIPDCVRYVRDVTDVRDPDTEPGYRTNSVSEVADLQHRLSFSVGGVKALIVTVCWPVCT